MNPEQEKFQEYMKALDEIRDRMIKADLIVRHGYSEKGKRLIGADFTPTGKEVVTTIYALHLALAPLTPKQIVLVWQYMIEIAEQRKKALGGHTDEPTA